MSAVIAEGSDGEPGGLDAAETVIHGQVNGATQAVQVQWQGRVAYVLLGYEGMLIDGDGWPLMQWAVSQRRAGGH